jgi:hypothetical protein
MIFVLIAEHFKPRKPEHFKRHVSSADSAHLFPPPHQDSTQPMSEHDAKVQHRHEKQEKREENALKAEKLNPNNPKYHHTSGTGGGKHGATTFGSGTKGEGNPSGGWKC